MGNDLKNMSTNAFDKFWSQVAIDEEYSILVTGNSMYPFLYHNKSIVYIVKKLHYNLKKGDIILFQRNDGAFVLHRVIKICSQNFLYVNGDAQSWKEEINTDQILAQVIKIRRTDNIFSVNNLRYRICVKFWMILFPIRPFLFKCRAKYIRERERLWGEKSKE